MYKKSTFLSISTPTCLENTSFYACCSLPRQRQALGYIDERLHMLVFTPRDGTVHVISLRRANQRKRTRYAAQTQP